MAVKLQPIANLLKTQHTKLQFVHSKPFLSLLFELERPSRFELTADELLMYAKENLDRNTPAAHQSVLTLLKQAIDCQMDIVLCCIGLQQEIIKGGQLVNFPAKLDYLAGVFSIPKVLVTSVNKLRNHAIHEHKSAPPRAELVQHAEIAELFVHALSNHLTVLDVAPDKFCVSSHDNWLDEPISLVEFEKLSRRVKSAVPYRGVAAGLPHPEKYYLERPAEVFGVWLKFRPYTRTISIAVQNGDLSSTLATAHLDVSDLSSYQKALAAYFFVAKYLRGDIPVSLAIANISGQLQAMISRLIAVRIN